MVVGVGGGVCVCLCGGGGGSDDSGHGVSSQARAYVQLIKRQQELLREAETFTCSDRSLVSDKLVNQPLYEEKGKKAHFPRSSNPSTLRY